MAKKRKQDDEEKAPRVPQGEQARELNSYKRHDPEATAQDCIDDLKRVQSIFPFKKITRDFYRLQGKYKDSTWQQHFSSYPEFKVSAELPEELNRDQRGVLRNMAHQVHLDRYRVFYDEQVLPYLDKYPKSPRDPRYPVILVASDFHDIHVDRFALAVFIAVAHTIQPDIIVLNGDIFDNYEASTKYEIDWRQVNIKERFDFVQEHIFAALRTACPNSQIDLVAGNHEMRILKLLASKAQFARIWMSDCLDITLAQWFGLDKYEINLVAKFDLAAFNKKEMAEELDENYKVYYDSWVAFHTHDDKFGMAGTSGHVHRSSMIQGSSLPMGTYDWMVTGAMKKCRAEYVDGRNKWNNGFGLVYIDVENRRVQQVPINIHGDFVVVEGRRFVRNKNNEAVLA